MSRARLLVVTTAGCVLGTALLGLAGPGDLWLACALIVVSNFFFGTGENVVAAFLPELAKGNALGKVSACAAGVGLISYHIGVRPKFSSNDVSRSVTATILWSTLYVLIVHFTFAFFEFNEQIKG